MRVREQKNEALGEPTASGPCLVWQYFVFEWWKESRRIDWDFQHPWVGEKGIFGAGECSFCPQIMQW